MSDLISRQAAIDALIAEINEKPETYWDNGLNMYDVESVLKGLPPAKPEKICVANITLTDEQVQEAIEKAKRGILVAQPERKRGKWIVYKAPDKQHCGLVKCPFCGEDMIAEADEYNFCPNCGADMRGDSDE